MNVCVYVCVCVCVCECVCVRGGEREREREREREMDREGNGGGREVLYISLMTLQWPRGVSSRNCAQLVTKSRVRPEKLWSDFWVYLKQPESGSKLQRVN